MTREEHIKAAERLLGRTPGCDCCPVPAGPTPEQVARAQVHATLALALSQPEVPR